MLGQVNMALHQHVRAIHSVVPSCHKQRLFMPYD